MVSFYYVYRDLLFIAALGLPVLLAVIHYLAIGTKAPAQQQSSLDILRFNLAERILHLLRLLAFIVVASTGTYSVYIYPGKSIGMVHSINGIVFFLMSLLTFVIWCKFFFFKAGDGVWLRSAGGYLSKKHRPLPSGRFNAGQKVLFWLTMLFTVVISATGGMLLHGIILRHSVHPAVLAIHGSAAALIIALIIGHAYLSLVANPGTWRVVTGGKVSREWAEYHHPDWHV